MSAWPELDEIKQVLDITSDDWDGAEDEYMVTTRLTRALESAIAYVKAVIGDWDELLDEPTANQSQAALRMAELLATRPDTDPRAIHDVTFQRLMVGSRRKWGIA